MRVLARWTLGQQNTAAIWRPIPRTAWRGGRIAILLLFTATSAASVTVPRECGNGGRELRSASGAVSSVIFYDRTSAQVTSSFTIPTSRARKPYFGFGGDTKLRVEYRWPYTEFRPQPFFAWPKVRKSGRPTTGTVQFECGGRNMGLMNFRIDYDSISNTSEAQQAVECMLELDIDPAFSISLDQSVKVRELISGTVKINATRNDVEKYILQELVYEKAGDCHFSPPPVIQ